MKPVPSLCQALLLGCSLQPMQLHLLEKLVKVLIPQTRLIPLILWQGSRGLVGGREALEQSAFLQLSSSSSLNWGMSPCWGMLPCVCHTVNLMDSVSALTHLRQRPVPCSASLSLPAAHVKFNRLCVFLPSSCSSQHLAHSPMLLKSLWPLVYGQLLHSAIPGADSRAGTAWKDAELGKLVSSCCRGK
jgi:hypothetical protein